MKMPDFKSIFSTVASAAKKHSPEILTGIGIVGMVSTTILAVKATPKAVKLIEEKEHDKKVEGVKDTKLTIPEVVKTTWKCYLPSTIIGACSIGCLIGASSVNARRNAALAASYAIAETTLTDYKDKVTETFGEKKEKEVRDAIAKDKIEKNPVNRNEIYDTGKGTTLCYDPFSAKYFWSDINWIKKCVNLVNERLLFDEYVALNDLYLELGLEDNRLGADVGWNLNAERSDKGLIELYLSSQLSSDDEPCVVLDFINPPHHVFD